MLGAVEVPMKTPVEYMTSAVTTDLLSELGRATTVYHEASPDRVESAREEYEDALRKFYAQSRP